MLAYMNGPFNVHYMIQKELRITNDLCWIDKACVEIKLNRLENVLIHYKIIQYLPSPASDHLQGANG